MLLTGKAYAEGARAFTSYVALQIDRELHHPDADVRKEAADEVALLTPVIKAFITDNAWIATSEAMQVFAATATSRSGAWSSMCATRAST